MRGLVFVLFVCGMLLVARHKDLPVSAQAHIVAVRGAVESCDVNNCIGGYVKLKNGDIRRIDTCGDNCGIYVIDINKLKYRMGFDEATNNIADIIPPGTKEWSEVLPLYAKQFVPQRDPP